MSDEEYGPVGYPVRRNLITGYGSSSASVDEAQDPEPACPAYKDGVGQCTLEPGHGFGHIHDNGWELAEWWDETVGVER